MFTRANFIHAPFTFKRIICLLCSRSYVASKAKPTLTMFTKEECSLCEEAKEALIPYIDKVIFNEVDITDAKNKEYFYKYRFDIPVFHLNGKYLMKHRINKELLDTALSREK
ncbi:glutaredoxin-like protein C5orf63 homolog [Octopus bimaculoides]|uniref:Glutaredoxin-like protein n=1 Tax=Octopus bimaculoides TaxID=37653 RepID=A0A0L8G327_OCTBM|nr:glutaredoxin-like protein C5orf63 homolog [Octopus bimaculoides]|eukprot:XP_014784688.1 PREDICTED: glutaredoxin-like protein C5orf63 homolog [Octopus bimaculoides]